MAGQRIVTVPLKDLVKKSEFKENISTSKMDETDFSYLTPEQLKEKEQKEKEAEKFKVREGKK